MKTDTPPASSWRGQLVWLRPLLGLAIVLILFSALLAPRGQIKTFLSVDNLQVLLHNSSVELVLALGMLLVIVSGGIDLSVGSVLALVMVMTIQGYTLVYDGTINTGSVHYPFSSGGEPWRGTQSILLASGAAGAVGIVTGGLCGLCNGLLIVRLRLAPFVATLGTLSVMRGLALWAAGLHPISLGSGPKPRWMTLLQSAKAPQTILNPGVWLALVLAGLVAVLLRYSVFGRYCYAIGSNEATARLCGVPVARTKVMVYVVAGLLAGVAGVMRFARSASGDPNTGEGMELIVIAAVVIGGASLRGGQGNVLGTLVGVLIWGIIDNGVGYFNADVEVKYVLIGVFFIANTALSQWQQRRTPVTT